MNEEQKDEQSAVVLSQQLVKANTTIAVLTAQLKAAEETQRKLEKELEDARRNSATPLMTQLAVANDRLKTANERQTRLEKELADARSRAPQLETELAVAKEQLKAFDDRLKAAKLEQTLQTEKLKLQLEAVTEKYELQLHNMRIRCSDFTVKFADTEEESDGLGSRCTSEDPLMNTKNTASSSTPSEKLYLAPMMLTPDTSGELICVAFITESSRKAIDDKVQRLNGQIVPGAKAVLVESEATAETIMQTIVDRGQTLVKRKRHDNPTLNVEGEFSEPNKLCTRLVDDESTAREEFLDWFRLRFTPLDELVEKVEPLSEMNETKSATRMRLASVCKRSGYSTPATIYPQLEIIHFQEGDPPTSSKENISMQLREGVFANPSLNSVADEGDSFQALCRTGMSPLRSSKPNCTPGWEAATVTTAIRCRLSLEFLIFIVVVQRR